MPNLPGMVALIQQLILPQWNGKMEPVVPFRYAQFVVLLGVRGQLPKTAGLFASISDPSQ